MSSNSIQPSESSRLVTTQRDDLASALLAHFSVSPELRNFLGRASTLGPGSWTKLGQANRELAALELAYPERADFFGLSREKLKTLLVLQEVFEPYKLATVPERLESGDNKNRRFHFDKFGLSNAEVDLGRALRGTLEIFKRGFLTFQFGSNLNRSDVFAECLRDLSTHTQFTPAEFFNYARLWISLFVVSRSNFKHLGLATGSLAADLEFLLEQPLSYRKGKPQLDGDGNIRMTPSFERILEEVRAELAQ